MEYMPCSSTERNIPTRMYWLPEDLYDGFGYSHRLDRNFHIMRQGRESEATEVVFGL